jgi:protein-S-isoprenylcysteine O-methyltransferase Ste14
VTVYIPYLILNGNRDLLRADLGVMRYLGIPLIGLGAATYVWCASDFIRARGTPAPIDPPKEMVAQGLYRVVRNPMYVGVVSALFGEAIFFGSGLLAIYGVIIFGIVHLFVVTYEEPTLRRRFGETYERYCEAVPRWIPTTPS